MIANRKSASLLNRAARPVVEVMERRQMLSATLTASSSLMVFNAVQNSSASATQTLTLTDTGNATLSLGSGAFSLAADSSSSTNDTARFTLLNASAAPATLAPGASFGLQIAFSANAVVTNKALLDIVTNDSANPTQIVSLHGIGTVGLGGSNQPSLATILQAYNIPTYVGEGFDDANAASDSTYPNTNNIDPSTQEVVMQRFEKAGTGPVTINVLASFTASGFAKSYTLGTYAPGEPTTLNELFYTPANENQTTYIQPQGSTSFDPGSNPFGFYFISNVQVQGRVGYSEDSLNTWDTNNASTGSSTRKMRFFPMELANGTIVPNQFIMTSTEWNGPSGYDFTNIVAIVSNIMAAPSAPTAPVLGLQNLNAEPGSTTMVFNRIQGTNPTLGDVVHDSNTLQVNNTGGSPLTINSVTLSDTTDWQITSPTSFPQTVAAGSTLAITVKFIAQKAPSPLAYNETNTTINGGGGGVYDANLVITSNDPNNPSATVPLRGWWQLHSENDNEPGVKTIINLLEGWDTFVDANATEPDLTESSSTSGSVPTYYGEEVVSPYWQEADTSAPVTVQQIASYHTEGNTATTSYYIQGSSGSLSKLFTTASDDGQTMYPLQSGSTALALKSFNSTGTFGFNVDGLFSQDSLNVNSTSGQGGGHHFRFYPIRNADGTLVPNDYIMAFDYAASPENYDFQDTLYVVTNIRPAVVVTGLISTASTAAPPVPTDITALSSNGVNTITWAAPLYTNLAGYNIFRGSSSPTGTYTQINTSILTSTTFTDSGAAATGSSYYKVVAVDSGTGLHSLGDITSVANTGTPTTGNGAPVAAAETATTSAATPVTINVAAGATDNANGTIVASSVAISTAPANGQTSINTSTGAITYTPAAGFTGTDTFQYTISDTTGATSAPATVTITVSSVPIGDPVAANLSFEVSENKSLDFSVSTAATDSTATIVPTSVVITQSPSHGSASVDPLTGNILYTPATGYLGTDTLDYTIGDSLGAVSSPGVVTLTVSTDAVLTGPVTLPVSATASSNGGASSIDVLSSATDASATLNPASVAITTAPLHGTAVVNLSTGVIVYTPFSGYLGTDSLQYTVADSLGQISAPATVSVNDGITINNSTAKSLTFTDASGSLVTLSLTGGGSALLSFTGSGNATSKSGPHGTGTLTATGSELGIDGISISGTTIASALTITRKKTSATTVGNITVAGALGKISAATTTLTGNITIAGGLTSIQSAGFTGATITIGSAGAKLGGVTIVTGNSISTTLSSALAIKAIKATEWVDSAASGSISAPSISSLVTSGDFLSGITTTLVAKPSSLGTVHIGGRAGGVGWNITGVTGNIVVGSVAPNFTAIFSSSVNSLTIRSGGFAGNISAGSLNGLSITGNDSGTITAGSIKSARVVGSLSGASITVTNAVAPRVTSLGRLQVTGGTDDSIITSAGNIGSISTGGMDGSFIEAGIATGVTLPSTATDFSAPATLSGFAITGRGNTFTNSDIAAQTIGNLSLGTITTANQSIPFGIAADSINSLVGNLDIGGALRMNRNVLASSDQVQLYLIAKSFTLGDFVIRPGL